jgi:DNA repair exonuclease SbcCD ATPase subunit
MDATLKQLIVERLDSERTNARWVWYVLAACESWDDLEKQMGGAGRPVTFRVGPATPNATGEPPGAYIRAITVEGFRGVGPRATLTLPSGPGLTLVVGRNGSGKSSFAEGIELLLTGKNRRWDGRPTAWRDGWRNLHHATTCIVAEFTLEGRGTSTITRSWEPDVDLEAGKATWQPHGGSKQSLETLGWDVALSAYRPFLPYSELGDLLTEKPAALHDALSKVLGLEDLTKAQKLLQEARLVREHFIKDVTARLDVLLERIHQVLDETRDGRAEATLRALTSKPWDLTAAAAAVKVAASLSADPLVNLLRQALGLQAPSTTQAESMAGELLAAWEAVKATEGTDGARAMELATLLEQALNVHRHAGNEDCPVCGTGGKLTELWRLKTTEQIQRLRTLAKAATGAHARLNDARRAAEKLLTAPPSLLRRVAQERIPDAAEALAAWEFWHEGPKSDAPEALATHLRESSVRLAEAMKALIESIEHELKRRDDKWLPVAQDVRTWLDDAKRVPKAKEQHTDLKKAEQWFKAAETDLRTDRFRPIAEKAREIWGHLRQNSNVELDDVQLEGSATKRRVALDVTVDGVKGAALGVMSQGELNALALSLFMPRASLSESPFRFMVIDDPVQSMDPSRIDGLAQALSAAAKSRQVVVFTHDERLPEATRYLGLPATIIEVMRQPASRITVRSALTPVEGYLSDAHAVVRTPEMPDFVKRRVIPGLCRSAIEAACMQCVRMRRLKRGEKHEVVEELLGDQKGLSVLAALALFDDEKKTADVSAGLRNRWTKTASDAFRACNSGAHDGYEGDLDGLLYDVKTLAGHIQVLP